jgi:hypothetical protein
LQLQEHLTKQILITQKTEALNNGWKKQLEAKGELLKSNNQKHKQLQTTIDGLTQTVKSLNETVQRLCAQPKDVSRC